jgi:hypothetical protein
MDQFQSQAPQSAGDTGEPQFVMPPKNHTKLWLVVFILAVLAILAGVYYFGGLKKRFFEDKQGGQQQAKPVVTNQIPEGYKPVVLEKGKYPEGFPMEAVVKEGDPIWQRSEDTVDGVGLRHRVVDLLYQKKSTEIISAYTASLSKSDWIIEQESNTQAVQVVVFVKKGNASPDDQQRLVVACSSQGEGTLVSLQYLTKN